MIQWVEVEGTLCTILDVRRNYEWLKPGINSNGTRLPVPEEDTIF